jgi:hypothetical protein
MLLAVKKCIPITPAATLDIAISNGRTIFGTAKVRKNGDLLRFVLHKAAIKC